MYYIVQREIPNVKCENKNNFFKLQLNVSGANMHILLCFSKKQTTNK